jgi:hypothetical protein
VEKIDAQIKGHHAVEEQRIAKIQRQKRRRSRRAKLRMLAEKRRQAQKKSCRAPVEAEFDS